MSKGEGEESMKFQASIKEIENGFIVEESSKGSFFFETFEGAMRHIRDTWKDWDLP